MESRMPPQNLEAEQSVLGSVLLDNEVFSRIEGTLRTEHFYKEGHRKIFRAMERLFRRGDPIDLVTITEELRQSGDLEGVGSVPYLIGLADSVPTAAYAENYARIVVEKAILRELISTSGAIMQSAFDQAMPLEQILDKAEASIFDMSSAKRTQDFQGMGELVTDTFAYINELFANPDPVSGLRTGFKELDQLTAGLQPSSLNVLAARPSMGKCLTKDTLLVVPGSGERITIEEFVRRRLRCVYGISSTGAIRPTRVSDWIDSGIKPCFRVITRTGRSVEVTGHHPFLTHRGWTPLHDLGVGDKVAVPRRLASFGQVSDLPLGKVRLLAYFIAGGGLTRSSPVFTNTDPVIVNDFTSLIGEYFPELRCRANGIDITVAREYRPGQRKDLPNPLTLWLREHRLMGKGAADKRFPDVVWQWDRERMVEFLRVLFSCEGTIYALSEARRPRIEFTVASQELARDVHHALVRFGIVSKLWRKTERSWRVEITEPESVDVYGTEIGWLGEKASRSFRPHPLRFSNSGHLPNDAWRAVREAAAEAGLSLSELARRSGENVGSGYNPHTGRGLPQKRLAGYAQVLERDDLRQISHPDLYWDDIVSIEAIGEHQVYDLTVPDGANFVAADFCVHNTSLALSLAQHVALREAKPVGIFSLEMSGLQLVTRMLCSEARVDMSRVRNGQLSDRDFQRLADTAGRMSEAKIYIDDNADMTVMELRSRARRLVAEHGPGLIVIDYLQLMSGGTNNENRQQEISNISRGLKALARELDVPVLVLSQLSRAVESRPNKRPMLSDLRECVTGDTLVVLADGRRVPIRDLVGKTPEVVALGTDGRLTVAKSDKVWEVGTREVFEVRLASGRKIRATSKHRLVTQDGWKRIANISEGDRVALARHLPEPEAPVRWPDSEVALLGQLIGGGTYLSGQPLRYTTASEENSQTVLEGAQALGSTVKRYAGRGCHQLLIGNNGSRWKPAGVGGWLKQLGIFGQRSHQKRIPGEAFRLGNDQIALLLRHLWATDGCILAGKAGSNGSHTACYASNSRGLAFDVAALLLRLGIVARVKSTVKGDHRPGYQVFVSGTRDQRRFLEIVATHGPRVDPGRKLLEALAPEVGVQTNVDTLPKEAFRAVRSAMAQREVSQRKVADLRGRSYGGMGNFVFNPSRETMLEHADLLQDAGLHEWATSDLFWDKVVEVVPAGEEVVYDLTVPGPSSWIADSIISHNSGAIEQDADLVMFIYRDEYYDPHSEKQGIAEVIIGKQRNGPVGTVELQFHNAHVRFNDLARSTG
ncbi:MAG TPA: replicative DNA helicase [Trueperaceae bacterium]